MFIELFLDGISPSYIDSVTRFAMYEQLKVYFTDSSGLSRLLCSIVRYDGGADMDFRTFYFL
jgi:hypothetical protein